MNPLIRKTTTALAVATLALGVGACNKGGDKPADDKATAAKPDDATAQKIPGLATEKEQVSYMIGMGMGKQLETAKDEIDVDTIAKAVKSTLAGEKLLMTDEQAKAIAESFGQKMQAKQIADQMAKGRKNETDGVKFLAENAKKPGVTTTPSGLQYQVLTAGKGVKPTASDVVKVQYKGTDLEGKTFDSTYDRGEPAMIPLGGVVPGWREGIMQMPVGSKYRLWIPGKLGYGENVPPGAPFGPNATLVFDVELIDIAKPGEAGPPMPAGPAG